MKTEYKEVKFDLDGISYTVNGNTDTSYVDVDVRMPIDTDLENLKIFEPVQIPETLKEFIKDKNITKKELLDWLNENYK